MAKRIVTTKDVSLLRQLHEAGQLELAPEYQRDNVWPKAAKAYLIDSIIVDRAIPLIFLRRLPASQLGQQRYEVVDGQQRLRAVFEFLEDKFPLSESKLARIKGKKNSELSARDRESILQYDFVVLELVDYSVSDIIDTFIRMNKYSVRLSPQEIRHASAKGAFKSLVDDLSTWSFWKENKVFTKQQVKRFVPAEFAAEISILLVEGPQDKKKTIDVYYEKYRKADRLPFRADVTRRLESILDWILNALPDLDVMRYRKPVELYGLIGALDMLYTPKLGLRRYNAELAGAALERFADKVDAALKDQRAGKIALLSDKVVARYVVATSRQTDNIRPRITRIETLRDLIVASQR